MGSELLLLAEAAGQASTVNPLILYLTIFMLAIFVGFEIITKIPPTLHTPLMSGSNAISGITLVGAVLAAGHGSGALATILYVSGSTGTSVPHCPSGTGLPFLHTSRPSTCPATSMRSFGTCGARASAF